RLEAYMLEQQKKNDAKFAELEAKSVGSDSGYGLGGARAEAWLGVEGREESESSWSSVLRRTDESIGSRSVTRTRIRTRRPSRRTAEREPRSGWRRGFALRCRGR